MARAAMVMALGFATSRAAAEEHGRPPLSESLLTESATDVDAEEAGELELEANVATLRARRGSARATLTSLELEWRVFEQVGLRIEPSYARVVNAGAIAGRDVFGFNGALAFGLLHDFPRDMHLQLELLGRTPESADARVFGPGETELPASADLVSAIRRGRWTLRATVGGEVGGSFAHAPLHTDFALLTGIVRNERFGFVGLEARADWARETPFVIAPEVVADLTSVGLPLRLGIAVPFNVGADPAQTSYGLFARVQVLTGREAAYERPRSHD